MLGMTANDADREANDRDRALREEANDRDRALRENDHEERSRHVFTLHGLSSRVRRCS